MRLHHTFLLLVIAAVPVAAMADNVNLSTGTAAYTITGPVSGPAINSSANAAWTASIPGAVWVNTTGSGTASSPNGAYVYTTLFSLTSLSNLSGSFASDNAGSLYLSGTGITGMEFLAANTYSTSFTSATSFSALDLGPGSYTLTADVENGSGLATGPDNNSGSGPTGLLVGANTVSTTPEPSSLALLGTGVLGALGMARRRLFSR